MSDGLNESSGVRLAPGVVAPAGVFTFSFVASAGPGGQNVNKRATKCTLRVRLEDLPIPAPAKARLAYAAPHLLTADGDLIITADEHRSQSMNKDAAIERLGELVRVALVPPKTRRATRPSRSSKERRLREKKTRSDIKRRRSSRED